MSAMTLRDHPFGVWFGIDEGIVSRVLTEALSCGAEFADAYFQHTGSMSIALEDGLVTRANTGVEQGVGVRAVLGDQVGYSFSESLDLGPMLTGARTAAGIASGASGASPQAVRALDLPDRYRLERDWEAVGISERLPLLQKAEGIVRQMEPDVQKISIYWNDSDQRVLVATSDGVFCADRRPMAMLACQVTLLKDGKYQSHSVSVARREGIGWFTDERIRDLCRRAVDNTRILFEARRPAGGEMPVVLAAGASGILLHEAIGHGLEADYNRKGTSIYATLVNQKVAPDFVTIVDDGTQANVLGALNVDDEGTLTERTVLIERGVLRSYMHDRISARHYGIKPTGSGRRESFRHAPMPRMRSTYMLDGPHTRDEIIAAVDRGIIAETFTNGQVQIGAGDFTFYVKNGWLIENGKITAPIKDVNIIGNGPEALKNVTMAAADACLDQSCWTCGKNGQGVPVSLGIPTVLVKSLTVGGVNA